MRKSHREILHAGSLPSVDTSRATTLVIDIDACRGVDILRVGHSEIILLTALLSRRSVEQLSVGVLSVEEIDIINLHQIAIVGIGHFEVEVARTLEVVERRSRTTQITQIEVANTLLLERVVDSPIAQDGIQRLDIEAVGIRVNIPFEVIERTNRIAEKV